MDNIFAIGVGLTLRAIIDALNQNPRIGGSLVGLWEGAVLHHFSAKFPRSIDPFIAFGFRLFIDLIFTESFTRLTIVVLWAGMGMLLSDLSVDLSADKRFRRVWRRVRHTFHIPAFRLSKRTPAVRGSTASRVQFIEVPASSSTVTSTSNVTARSPRSPLGRGPPVTVRAGPPPPRPRTSHPVPGAFSSDRWSETNTDIGLRDASRERPIPRPMVRTPSEELEYIAMPVIPDVLDEDPRVAIAPHDRSGLTTPTSEAPGIVVDAPSAGHSGLTTPVLGPTSPHIRGDQLPPVTIFHDDDNDDARTHNTQSDLPPIPIPMRPTYNVSEEDGAQVITFPVPSLDIPEIPSAQPSPSLPIPAGFMPDIPTPMDDGTRTMLGERATQSPPPSYEPPPQVAKELSDGADSVISGHSRNSIVTRADTLRSQADLEEKTRAALHMQFEKARRDGDFWGAFRLKVERDKAAQTARQLHEKAARRYYKAHNLKPEPQTIDVHRLKVPEAIAKVEEALYELMKSGGPELRIITGRGMHSKGGIPVLKLALTKAMQDLHIETTPDPTNPGVLLIRPPSAAGPSS